MFNILIQGLYAKVNNFGEIIPLLMQERRLDTMSVQTRALLPIIAFLFRAD